MEKKFIITQQQVGTLFAVVTRSTQIIPGLTTGDYFGLAQGLQNLPEFELEEQPVEVV